MDNESVKLTGEEDEEDVLLDLDAVAGHIDIPPNAPFVLAGLDTLNPTLTIDGKIKLIGEYLETIGTCLAFSEKEVRTGENQTPQKQVEPVSKLHKILKFRLAMDEEDHNDGRGNTS